MLPPGQSRRITLIQARNSNRDVLPRDLNIDIAKVLIADPDVDPQPCAQLCAERPHFMTVVDEAVVLDALVIQQPIAFLSQEQPFELDSACWHELVFESD